MIKADTYGDSSKSSTIYISIYHVNVQINIKPQLAMGLQILKGWGHDFTRDRVGRSVQQIPGEIVQV